MTPGTVPSTFPRHRLSNTDQRTFSFVSFSLSCNDFARHAFLSFTLKSKITETGETEVSNTVGTPNSPVFEKSEMLSWSEIVVGVVSPSTEVVLSGCCGLITCGVRGIGEVAKLPGARAEVRLTRACGSGKARRRRRGRERGVDVTVREQQGWRVKHEWRKRDGDMPHAHCKHLEPCVFPMSARHAKKMCVRQESVCTKPNQTNPTQPNPTQQQTTNNNHQPGPSELFFDKFRWF